MDELTLNPTDASVLVNRRERRSGVTTQALAYQCAHIQEGLALDALVVADDNGDRWVGAGDKALCRFLSRSAPALATGEHDAALKLSALQTISEGLEAAHVTTARIKVPHLDRHVYVTGVGANRMRAAGVATTAHGSNRILGYQRPDVVHADADAATGLQRLVDGAYRRLVTEAGLTGADPSGFMGVFDDRVYREALDHVLAPVVDTVARSGVIVEDFWRNYRMRTRERRIEAGVYERTFKAALRESRSYVRVGELEVRFVHRHDRWDVPCAPRIAIRWK